MADVSSTDIPVEIGDPTLWLQLVERLGPGFVYLLLLLLFALSVILIRQFPSIAPFLRWFVPWSQKNEAAENRPIGRQPELIDAEDAAEVIEATRRHGEMRILTKIADGENVAVVYMDTDGIIHVFNRAAEFLTGYSEAEVIGVNVSILMDTTHAKFHGMYVRSYLHEREQGNRSRLVGRVRYVTLKHKDGSMIPVKIRLTEISNGIRGFWATLEKNDPTTREPSND